MRSAVVHPSSPDVVARNDRVRSLRRQQSDESTYAGRLFPGCENRMISSISSVLATA